MKKPAKKYPGPASLAAVVSPTKMPARMPAPAPKKMALAKPPTEGSAGDVEPPGMTEGSSVEERYDQRQSARKSRPLTI